MNTPARPRSTLLAMLVLWVAFYASFTLFTPPLLDDDVDGLLLLLPQAARATASTSAPAPSLPLERRLGRRGARTFTGKPLSRVALVPAT